MRALGGTMSLHYSNFELVAAALAQLPVDICKWRARIQGAAEKVKRKSLNSLRERLGA